MKSMHQRNITAMRKKLEPSHNANKKNEPSHNHTQTRKQSIDQINSSPNDNQMNTLECNLSTGTNFEMQHSNHPINVQAKSIQNKVENET